MATHQSDIIKAKDALSFSEKADALSGSKTGAPVLLATAVYTVKGTEVNGDIIEITDLPPSAVVIPEQSYAAYGYPAGFNFASITLGDKALPARYGMASIDVGYTTHNARFGYSGSTEMIRVPEAHEKQTRIVAQLLYSNGRAAGGKVVFGIAYRVQG